LKSNWEEKVFSLKQELASMKNQALTITGKLELIIREMESLKPDIVRKYLEDQRAILVRQRGFNTILKHNDAMKAGMAIGIGSAILGGLLSKDPILALNAGMSGFDGLIQGLGETRWCVSLDSRLLVASDNGTKPRMNWVPWESITLALEELKKKAAIGEKIGNLGSIIKKLRAEAPGLSRVHRLPREATH